MIAALRIVQDERPHIMQYLKIYKVTFVQLRASEGKLEGRRAAIPVIVLRDPTSPTTGETSIRMAENGFSDGACLFLPLSDANAIAKWIVKQLDSHVRCETLIAERNLDVWGQITKETKRPQIA